jgi:hypothetical protein
VLDPVNHCGFFAQQVVFRALRVVVRLVSISFTDASAGSRSACVTAGTHASTWNFQERGNDRLAGGEKVVAKKIDTGQLVIVMHHQPLCCAQNTSVES